MLARPDLDHPAPPPGWRLLDGALVADGTVGGHVARRQDVRASCYQRDCRRTFNIDYDWMVRHGYAAFPVRELFELLRCRKPGGCALEMRSERQGSGLPLSFLARQPGVMIRLICQGCGWRKDVGPAQVVAQLAAVGIGDGATLHVELTAKLTKPCVKCAKAQWASEVRWPPVAGSAPRARAAR